MFSEYDALASVVWDIFLYCDKVLPGRTLLSHLTLSLILFLIPAAGWSKKKYSALGKYSGELPKKELLELENEEVIAQDPVVLGWIEELDKVFNYPPNEALNINWSGAVLTPLLSNDKGFIV